jgi:UDP-N-acetylmuramoyl-L-alanyl-D-glutamate--2,6-diaminopimelate ligase
VRAIGEVHAENALAALAGAVASGVPAEVAARAIAAAPPPPGRFEVVAERPYLVVDYAHSPDALERLVRTAKRIAAGRVTVVFGAGGDRDRAKRAPMGRAARAADRVIVTTDNPRREDPAAIASAIHAGLEGHPRAGTILDRGEAIASAVRDAGPDDVVLVAGRGHEADQVFADGRRPFSDVDVLRRLARS